MREIIFRGKRVDNGKWVYGSLFKEEGSEACNIMGFDYYGDAGGLQRDPFDRIVDSATVGQFTGLRDKNKQIFEGDICKNEADLIGVVVWEGQGFMFKYGSDGFKAHVTWFGENIKVIGNIHDNPELLRQEAV